jgi:hypothetical protein
MNPQISYSNAACYRWLMEAGILLLLLSLSSVSSARPLTATITDLKGQVRLYGRIGSPVIGSTVKVGEALRADDTIQTQDGAAATLTLSDGSILQLSENTQINIVALVLEPATRARKSQLKLLRGHMRATLSPEPQKHGSSFTIKTPNALAETESFRKAFSVIEASYNPTTETSLFKAYTGELIITNYFTREVNQVPEGNQAIVQRESTLLSPISEQVTLPRDSPLGDSLIQQSRRAISWATSTAVPLSVGVVGSGGTTTTETITDLSPGALPENRGRPQPVKFSITVTIQEKE